MRFLYKKNRKLDENYYVRGDGTCTYFFSLETLQELFESGGFRTERLSYDTREIKNRKRMISMYRVWARAKFVKPLE